ncbi:T7SS effector LXG polymorphic toxin [Streptococcus suis]|uniref:T7SS effector LXG polymorphic toxin n=1 Tax=Streptococcus suis TaxID=1307 RepID=UPI000CF60168|nr:T7SS effector LXG polymorphic toxin [Streptococcus suis]
MVKMNLPSSDNQATSIGRVSASRMGAYESAMQALGSFIGAEGLSGQAYDNAKDYAASTLLPLLKAAILYEESLSEAVKRLPSDYRATEYLEGKSLDSDVLEAELARLESVGMRLDRSIDRALEMARDYPDYEWHAHSMMRQLNQVIDRKNKVRRQLQALYAFDGRSSGFFSGIGDLKTQLSQGISQVGSDMSNFSGSFPSGLSPVWVSAVNQKWNDRVKRMRDTSSPADFRKLEEREADASDLNADIYGVAEDAGIPYEAVIKWIIKGEPPGGYKIATGILVTFGSRITQEGEIKFLDGKKITVDSAGNVKVGNKMLYNQKTGHVYNANRNNVARGRTSKTNSKTASGEYRRSVGHDLDVDITQVGKARNITTAIDAAKSSFKSGLEFWDDFDWRASNISSLGKVGRAAKGLGMIGTVVEVGSNIQENFIDDTTSSTGEKIRNFAIDQGVDLVTGTGATAVGAAVGAGLGTLIPIPGVGTAIGFATGMIIGNLIDNLDIDLLGGRSISEATKDALTDLFGGDNGKEK